MNNVRDVGANQVEFVKNFEENIDIIFREISGKLVARIRSKGFAARYPGSVAGFRERGDGRGHLTGSPWPRTAGRGRKTAALVVRPCRPARSRTDARPAEEAALTILTRCTLLARHARPGAVYVPGTPGFGERTSMVRASPRLVYVPGPVHALGLVHAFGSAHAPGPVYVPGPRMSPGVRPWPGACHRPRQATSAGRRARTGGGLGWAAGSDGGPRLPVGVLGGGLVRRDRAFLRTCGRVRGVEREAAAPWSG